MEELCACGQDTGSVGVYGKFLVRVYPVKGGKTNKEVNSMKKRIFMLAVIAVLMLSSVGLAAAEDHIFFKLVGELENVSQDTSNDVTTVSFDVTVKYEVASKDDTSTKNPATDFSDGWFKNANLGKWELGGSSNTFVATSYTITTTSNGGTPSDPKAADVNDPNFLIYPFTSGNTPNAGADGTYKFTVVAKGKLEHPENSCQIRVSLYTGEDSSAVLSSYSASTPVKEVAGAELASNLDPIDYDPRNPDGRVWNGLDPTFSNTINTDSYDIGKNKPKLGKIDKANLTFTPGTEKDLTIEMNGPITLVDVYIAGKDAVKLYPGSGDKNTNIRLTSASIKAYKIPFRITSYDFAKTVAGSTAKEQQKAWKTAKSTLTLSFNGSKMQYKGFPITIAMSNSNTSSKPVAKAIKLNIGSNFTTPSWTYMVTSREITTSLDVAKALEKAGSWDSYKEHYKYVRVADKKVSGDIKAASWDMAVPAKVSYDVVFRSSDKEYYIIPEIFYTLSTDGKTVVSSVDNKPDQYVYSTKFGPVVDYYYCDLKIETPIDKKTKPEAVSAVWPDEKYAEDISTTFYASGDAPYAITLKPGLTDTDKLSKFFKENAIEVVQPVYDYLGNVEENGYVVIAGTPGNIEKESKLALTLTATNPSTKKKAAAKVTAMGKLAPVFDKVNEIDEVKWITTKRVQAGKAPSVKPKAKGSKTISYYLGEYYLDGDTLYDGNDGDEDYSHEALAAKLAALGLSFDAKKGVYAPDKTKLTVPTLNEEGDAFESLDIPITAANNVGTDLAYASVAITGAKPALSGKEVTFAATDAAYSYKTFALKAGKNDVKADDLTANVKATENGETLATYGLKMVTYDELLAPVKSTDKVAAGTKITDTIKGWTPDSKDYAVVSGSVKAIRSGDVPTGAIIGYTASTDIVMYNGKVDGVLSPDESLRNQGIIQIVNYTLFTTKGDAKTEKGVKVNVALDNFGAAGKGGVKVKIPASTATNGALPASVKALANNGSSTSSAAGKTNGTAGSYIPNNGAAPEADAETEADAEATVTIGAPRTAADLTAGQKAYLAAKGYKVIAVLPEISANADGQQEFAVELDEDAPEGAKMVYVPFPQDVEETEDDKIADFYGADGEAIEEVPAEKEITVAPWLRADVVYQPVIAVED